MKRLLSWVLLATLSLAAASICRAEGEFKPLVGAVLSSVDNMTNKVGTLAQGNPAVTGGINAMKMAASAMGIDTAAPCGAFVTTDKDGQAVSCTFLPISKVEAYVAVLKKAPIVESLDLDEGVYAGKNKDGSEFFVQQKGKWVYRADNREVLSNVPADPVKLFGNLPTKFDAAEKIFPANVTVDVCHKWLDRLQQQLKARQEGMPEGADAQMAMLFMAAKLALPAWVATVNQAEDAFLGLLIDQSSNRVRLDVEIKAANGTALADRFALWQQGKTKFGGFVMPEAAVSANWQRGMADDEVAGIKNAMAGVRASFLPGLDHTDSLSDDQVKLVKGWLDELIGVVEKTADNRRQDGGFALLLEPGEPAGMTVVAGNAVADGGKLETILKEVVAELKDSDPDTAKLIKLNVAKHEGVRFHKASLPMPWPALVPHMGETLEIVLGIDNDKVFLAAGADPVKALKKIISQSKTAAAKEVPPMQMTVSAASIAKYALSHVPMLAMMVPGADNAIKSLDGGKDHLVITAKPIYHGIRYRVELEEGLLKLLSTAPTPPAGFGPGGGPPPAGVPHPGG